MPSYIDLSVSIESDLPCDPPGMIPRIVYIDHALGAETMKAFIPELSRKDLPGGMGWAIEFLELSTHCGTHMDAPWHFHPTQDRGKPAMTIDEFPLEWGVANGVKLDFSDLPDGYNITAADVHKRLDEIGHTLGPGDAFLAQSGAAPYWGSADYLVKGCGFGREATLWILEQGVHVVGTDAWSWDRPLAAQAVDYSRTGDASLIWEGHFAGVEKGYFQIEKLTNLDLLPATGFKFYCFPVKIKGASAGWVRAVAEIL
ncbi:MAG TPA: cyclase family protein [Smithellaceae bacterium]|jgi:kynurenine formamidase|nr:cyclase family protein [Smithellaceae bacterium]HQG80929.1 cyclase family protein [Smithellaceae bacterium]